MAKRKTVAFLMTELGLCERRCCRIVGLARSVQQYRPVPKDDATVVARMKDLVSEDWRHGCPAPARSHAPSKDGGITH